MWVYDIGTHPYFTNVAPGEVTDLPPEDLEDSRPHHPRPFHHQQQQVVEYPTYHPVAEDIEQSDIYRDRTRPLPIHPVQYHPQQQTDELALLDSDIQVNGEQL